MRKLKNRTEKREWNERFGRSGPGPNWTTAIDEPAFRGGEELCLCGICGTSVRLQRFIVNQGLKVYGFPSF